jgi:hypothetical protein
MATHGAYTIGAARLSRASGLVFDKGGNASGLTSVYTLMLAAGTLPVLTGGGAVTGLPAVNSAHPTHADLRAQGYNFDCLTDNKKGYDIWEVSVPWAVTLADQTGEFGTSRITAASWGTHEWEQELVYDEVDDAPFVTASGGAYDSAPMIQREGRVVSFTRLQTQAPATLVALSGSLNSESVTCLGCTFAARTARVRVSARDTLATSGLRYEVTVEIRERNNVCTYGLVPVADDIGWDIAVLEADYYYLDTILTANRMRFMELEEEEPGEPSDPPKYRPSAAPQLLTFTGLDNRGGEPAYRRWHTAPGASWTTLRLPS